MWEGEVDSHHIHNNQIYKINYFFTDIHDDGG